MNDRDDICRQSIVTKLNGTSEEVHQRLVGLVAESGRPELSFTAPVVILGPSELFDFSQFHVRVLRIKTAPGESLWL